MRAGAATIGRFGIKRMGRCWFRRRKAYNTEHTEHTENHGAARRFFVFQSCVSVVDVGPIGPGMGSGQSPELVIGRKQQDKKVLPRIHQIYTDVHGNLTEDVSI